MKALGELRLAGHRFPIHHATFRRITSDDPRRTGWEFEIDTGPPVEEPADETEQFMFARGVRFYAEGDPIPLPDAEDLTGVEVFIEEPFDPVSGEVYFTLYVCEHGDVSQVRLRFVERRGEQYRLRVSALAHDIFEQPVELSLETWITRQPPHQYGEGAEPADMPDRPRD
jgi:hypothetical protein